MASMNLQASKLTFQFTPDMPKPLFPVAPIMPATCVPWNTSSIGSQLLVTALKPCVPAGQLMLTPLIVCENDVGADQIFAASRGGSNRFRCQSPPPRRFENR